MEKGDRVLVANKGERGKKLADCWESTVYIVVSKNSDLNTGYPSSGDRED